MGMQSDYTVTSASNTEKYLRALLRRYRPELGCERLRVQFHQNTCTMVSLSRRGQQQSLRLHWLFTKAPGSVLEAVVRIFFVREDRLAKKQLRSSILDFIDEHRHLTLSDLCVRQLCPPHGRNYDLSDVERTIRKRFLRDCSEVRIGWSRRVTPCLMGKWIAMPEGSPNIVVINRLLDSRRVPAFYLQYIVFHELLHEMIPIRRRRGRWVHHPAEFRQRERQFPAFERALSWERENIGKLFDAHLRRSRGQRRVQRARGGW